MEILHKSDADLMKNDIEDDWDPEIKKKDSILNKVVVNFSSKIINYHEILRNSFLKNQTKP